MSQSGFNFELPWPEWLRYSKTLAGKRPFIFFTHHGFGCSYVSVTSVNTNLFTTSGVWWLELCHCHSSSECFFKALIVQLPVDGAIFTHSIHHLLSLQTCSSLSLRSTLSVEFPQLTVTKWLLEWVTKVCHLSWLWLKKGEFRETEEKKKFFSAFVRKNMCRCGKLTQLFPL